MMMPSPSFSNPAQDPFKKKIAPPGSGPMAPIPGPTGQMPQQPNPLQPKVGTMPPTAGGWNTYKGPQAPVPAQQIPTPQPNAGMMNYIDKVASAQPAVTMRANPQPTAEPVKAPPDPVAKAGPTPQAGTPGSTLQDPGQISQAGKDAAGYVSGNAAKLGQDPGSISEAGKLYAERVTNGLKGDDPQVKNAQQTEDTAAARREYSARTATEESLGQTPFAPGSAQYQRAMDQSRAGVNAANQAGQAGVNQFTRQRTADNMEAARGLESQQYDRNRTNLKDAQGQEDTQYGRAVGERTNSQIQSQQLGNSIQDPKAKYAYNAAIAAGADPQEAYQKIVGSTGSINEQYRGQSPVQNVQQDATDWIKATNPNLKEGSPEFAAAVTARMQETDSTSRAPVTNAVKEQEVKTLTEKERSGETLTPTEEKTLLAAGTYKEYSPANLPTGPGNAAIGTKVNVGGKAYTYSAWDKYTNCAVLTDSTGAKKFIWGGKVQDRPPNEKGR